MADALRDVSCLQETPANGFAPLVIENMRKSQSMNGNMKMQRPPRARHN